MPKKVQEVTRIIRTGVRRIFIVYVQWGHFRAPLLGAYLRNPHTNFGDKLRLYLKFGKTKFAVNNAIHSMRIDGGRKGASIFAIDDESEYRSGGLGKVPA